MSDPSLVSGVVNFRDIGGLPAGERRTRSGVLYRSGNLAGVDERGATALRGLGLRRIIDLRDDHEVGHAPSRIDDLDVTVQRVPLHLGSIASLFTPDMTLERMYRSFVDDAAERVVEVVRGVIADQPVLVHCTIGKDRTGVTVAMILAAAGVDQKAIIADYALTETLLPEDRNRAVIARVRHLHPGAVNLEELATRSPAPVLHGLLRELDERYGSPTDYLRAHGVADDEIAELRRVLLEPA